MSKICCLIILVLLPHSAFSDEWPNCKFQCQADDVIISRLWLGDDAGNELSACIPGDGQKAYLWAEFSNNVDSPRHAVVFLAELYLNGVLSRSFYDEGQCITDLLPPRSTQAFSLYSFMWNCGDEVLLKKLVLSWETAKGTGCGDGGRKCSDRNAECYGDSGTGYLVEAPIAPSFLFDSTACSTGSLYFSDRTGGGLKPYLHYWDYGDGTHSSEQNPSHNYAKPGNYTVTLFITDESQKKASLSNRLVIRPCGCDIFGPSTTCVKKNETYFAEISDPLTHVYEWKLDEQEIKGTSQDDGKSIDINWEHYAPGQHILQLVVTAKDKPPQEASLCNMTVTVLPVPDVTITWPSN